MPPRTGAGDNFEIGVGIIVGSGGRKASRITEVGESAHGGHIGADKPINMAVPVEQIGAGDTGGKWFACSDNIAGGIGGIG